MKKQISIALILAVILPLFVFGMVRAEEGTGSSSGSGSTSSNETENETEADQTARQQRIEKRKAELKIRLSSLEQAKIKTKCKNSQGLVMSLSGRIKGLQTSRNQVYTNLASRLTKLSGQLKDQGLDTATLDTQIAELKTKVDTFKTDLTAYKEAASDLADMDCVNDPTGFKASLEAARSTREKVAKDAMDIKTYVNDTIKPTLVRLHDQLEAQENTSGENQ